MPPQPGCTSAPADPACVLHRASPRRKRPVPGTPQLAVAERLQQWQRQVEAEREVLRKKLDAEEEAHNTFLPQTNPHGTGQDALAGSVCESGRRDHVSPNTATAGLGEMAEETGGNSFDTFTRLHKAAEMAQSKRAAAQEAAAQREIAYLQEKTAPKNRRDPANVAETFKRLTSPPKVRRPPAAGTRPALYAVARAGGRHEVHLHKARSVIPTWQ
jgi:hypothetical protein